MMPRLTALSIAAFVSLAAYSGNARPVVVTSAQAPALPAPRWGHATTFDSDRNVVLVFGGTADGRVPLRDLWAWDGRQWTRLGNDSGPSARDAAVLAYDSNRKRVVMYGGRSSTEAALHDTWEWDGTRWSLRDTIGIGGRVHAVGTYDAERKQTLVYGGVSPQGEFLSDSWTWDGQRWTQAEKSQGIIRAPSGMAFDPVGRRVRMLAHARDTSGEFRNADLLEWDGRSWTTVPTSRLVTEPIQPIAITSSGSLVVFMGPTGETWTRARRGVWEKDTSAGPGARSAHTLVYDSARRRVVLFGGGDQQGRFGDTWEWDGERWDFRGPIGPTRSR